MKPTPCITPIETYSQQPVETTCHRPPPTPRTGTPESFGAFFWLAIAILIVGCSLWWFGRKTR